MRRVAYWWHMNWDTVLLWGLVFALAIAVSDLLGAFDDTIRLIRAGY